MISRGAAIEPASLGFGFQPVKRYGLAAASGTTPFGLLFLGFSMFLIAASLMLVALLFGLDITARAREIGVLLAVGLSRAVVLRILAAQGLAVTVCGGLLGVAAGTGEKNRPLPRPCFVPAAV